MNLNSVVLHVEIAKFGEQYLVRANSTFIPAVGGTTTSMMPSGDRILKNKEELQAWLHLLADKAP